MGIVNLGWYLSADTIVTWVATRIMHDGGRTRLSAIRLCMMDVTPCMALDVCESLHLSIAYLLRGEYRRLGFKS